MKSFYTFSPSWKDQLCQMCLCPSKSSLLLSPSTISLAGCTLFTCISFCHFSVFKPLYKILPCLTYFSLCARKNTQLKKRIQVSLQLKATEFLRLEGISGGLPAQPRAGCPGPCLVGFLGISKGRDYITNLTGQSVPVFEHPTEKNQQTKTKNKHKKHPTLPTLNT